MFIDVSATDIPSVEIINIDLTNKVSIVISKILWIDDVVGEHQQGARSAIVFAKDMRLYVTETRNEILEKIEKEKSRVLQRD